MKLKARIEAEINAEDYDDAICIISLLLEGDGIKINKLEVEDKNNLVVEKKCQ